MVKAVVLVGPNDMTLADLSLQSPMAGEVRVEMAYAGVCHSDINILNRGGAGPLNLPAVLGHEGAGRIVEVGRGVTDLQPGDHVVLAVVPQCGHCDYCAGGLPTLCRNGSISRTGRMLDQTTRFQLQGIDVAQLDGIGTWAEQVVVPAAAAVKIPDTMPLAQAALLGCAVVTGFGAAVNAGRVRSGEVVVVVGCGGVGLNAVQGARIAGAAQIIAADVRDAKLNLARRFGATATINVSEIGPVEEVRRLTDDQGAHVVLDFVGSQTSLTQAMSMLRPGGRCVVTGLKDPEWCLPARDLLVRGLTLTANYMGMGEFGVEFPRLVGLYDTGRLLLDELVSLVISLDEIPVAVDAIERGEVARCIIAISADG